MNLVRSLCTNFLEIYFSYVTFLLVLGTNDKLATAKELCGFSHSGCHPVSETNLHNYTHFVALNISGQGSVIAQGDFRARVTEASDTSKSIISIKTVVNFKHFLLTGSLSD